MKVCSKDCPGFKLPESNSLPLLVSSSEEPEVTVCISTSLFFQVIISPVVIFIILGLNGFSLSSSPINTLFVDVGFVAVVAVIVLLGISSSVELEGDIIVKAVLE